MMATEAIRKLTRLVEKHGDQRVVDDRDYSFTDFEYNDDEGEVFLFELDNSDNE